MFGSWGYLFWTLAMLKLIPYGVWLWKKGYRLGTAGVVFIALGTLALIIWGSVFGSGLE
ncbi:MAG: hypothetical protein ACM3WV_08820 [Bacillota bacterium]